MLHQGPGHRIADGEHRVDPLGRDGSPHGIGVEARRDDDLVAPVQPDEQTKLAGAVYQRRDHVLNKLRVSPDSVVPELRRIPDRFGLRVASTETREEEVLLPPYDALRKSRRAA